MTAVACFLIALLVPVVLAAPSRADVIPDAITSITAETTRVGEGEQVRFSCTWAVPDGSSPGDTFGLTLPEELRWYGARTFDLLAPDGSSVATATVDTDGHVTFTLTDYIASHPRDVHGTCSFVTLYSVPVTGDEVDLEFLVGDTVVSVRVDTEQPCATDCAGSRDEAGKDMDWRDAEQTTTRSVVWAPATTADSSTVSIIDMPGPGLSLDCSSVTAHIGRQLGREGRLSEPYDDDSLPAAVDCAPGRLLVTWSEVPEGEYAEVRVNAVVTEPGRAEYSNEAQVAFDGIVFPVESRVIRTDASGTGSGETPTGPATTTTTTSPPSTTTTSPPSTTTASPPSTTTSSPSTTSTRTSSAKTTPPSASTVTLSTSALAHTGSDVAGVMGTGLLLLLGGGALLKVASRPRRH